MFQAKRQSNGFVLANKSDGSTQFRKVLRLPNQKSRCTIQRGANLFWLTTRRSRDKQDVSIDWNNTIRRNFSYFNRVPHDTLSMHDFLDLSSRLPRIHDRDYQRTVGFSKTVGRPHNIFSKVEKIASLDTILACEARIRSLRPFIQIENPHAQ